MASKYYLIAVILLCVILQGMYAQFRYSRRSSSRLSSRLSPRLPTRRLPTRRLPTRRLPTRRLQRPRELSRSLDPLRTMSRSRIPSSRAVPGRIRYRPRLSEVSVPSVRRTAVPRRGVVNRIGLPSRSAASPSSSQREITPVRLQTGMNRLSPLSQEPWSLRVGQVLPGNFQISRNIFNRMDDMNNNNNKDNIDPFIRRQVRKPVATRTIQSLTDTRRLPQQQLQNGRLIHAPLLPRRKGQVRYQRPKYELPKVLTRQSHQRLTGTSVNRHAQYPRQQQQQRQILSPKSPSSPLRPSVLFKDNPVKVGHRNALPFQSTFRNAISFPSVQTVSKNVPAHVGHIHIETGRGDGDSGTVVVQTRFSGKANTMPVTVVHSGQDEGNVEIRTQVAGRTGQYNTQPSAFNVEPVPVVVQTVKQHAETIPLFENGNTKVHTQILGQPVQQPVPVIASKPVHTVGHVQVQTLPSVQMVDHYSPSLGANVVSVPLHDPIGIQVQTPFVGQVQTPVVGQIQTPVVGQPLQEIVPSAPNTYHQDLVDAFTSVIESVLDPQGNVGLTSGHPIVTGQTVNNNIQLPIATSGVGVSHQGVVQSNVLPQQTGMSQFVPARMQGGMFGSRQFSPYNQFGQVSPYGYMNPWMTPEMMQEMMYGDTTDPPDGLTTTAAPLNVSATNVTDTNATAIPLTVDIVHTVDIPVTVPTPVIDVIAHVAIEANVNDVIAQAQFKDTTLDIKASEKAVESLLNAEAPVQVIVKAKDNTVDIKASTELVEPFLNAETPVHVVVKGKVNTSSNDNGTPAVTVVEVNPGISSIGNVDVAVVDANTITDTIVDNIKKVATNQVDIPADINPRVIVVEVKPEVMKTKDLNTNVAVVQVVKNSDVHAHAVDNLLDLATSKDIVQTIYESNKVADANIKVDISHVKGESKSLSETLSTIVDATADVKSPVVEVKLKHDSAVTVVTRKISDNIKSELKPVIKVQSKDKSKQLILDIASLIRHSKVDMGKLAKMITGQASSKVDIKPKPEPFPTADQLGIKLPHPDQHNPIVHAVQRPTLPSVTYTLQPKQTPTIPPVPEAAVIVHKLSAPDVVVVDDKKVIPEVAVVVGKISASDVVVVDNKHVVPEAAVGVSKISAPDVVVVVDDKAVVPEAAVVVGKISASDVVVFDKIAVARNPLPVPTLIPKGLVFTRQPEIYRTIRTLLKHNPDALKKIMATVPTPTHHIVEPESFKNILDNANTILNDQLPIIGHPKNVKHVEVTKGNENKAHRREPVRIHNLIDNTKDGSAPALVSILAELTNTQSKTSWTAAPETPVLSNVVEHSVRIEQIEAANNSNVHDKTNTDSNIEVPAANGVSVNSTARVDGAVLHEQLIHLNVTDKIANAEAGIDLAKYLSDPSFLKILRGMLQSMAGKQQQMTSTTSTTSTTSHPEPETTTFYPESSTMTFPQTSTEEIELEDLVTVEP